MRIVHGSAKRGKESSEYRAWVNMRARIRNKNDGRRYKHYGGRGIVICDRWLIGEEGKTGFECFIADMGPKPHPKLSLERKNVDGNYDPANCCWATQQTQLNNKRGNILVTRDGETLTLAQWSRKLGVGHDALRYLLRVGRFP